MSDQTFTAIAAIQGLSLGALLGAAGQGVRVIVGLKKAAEYAHAAGSTLKNVFDASKLFVSLLIGAVAGILASIPFLGELGNLTQETVVALLGAGYAGADFVEGFMQKAVPGANGANSPNPPNAITNLPSARPSP